MKLRVIVLLTWWVLLNSCSSISSSRRPAGFAQQAKNCVTGFIDFFRRDRYLERYEAELAERRALREQQMHAPVRRPAPPPPEEKTRENLIRRYLTRFDAVSYNRSPQKLRNAVQSIIDKSQFTDEELENFLTKYGYFPENKMGREEFLNITKGFEERFLASLSERQDISKYTVESDKIRQTSSEFVMRVEIEGQTKYWRPFEKSNAGRLSLLAYMTNQKLGLNTVSKADLAYINGQPGVLSEAVENAIDKDEIYSFYENSTPSSVSNTMVFEYLIGNNDVHFGNFEILNDIPRTVEVFDHGSAFNWTPFFAYDGEAPLGMALPNAYTREFYEALLAFDEKAIQDFYEGLANEKEIQGIIKRRLVILEDIELRRESEELGILIDPDGPNRYI